VLYYPRIGNVPSVVPVVTSRAPIVAHHWLGGQTRDTGDPDLAYVERRSELSPAASGLRAP